MDLAIAVPAALVTLPLLAGLALAIRLTSPGPAVHWSRRVGRGGRTFAMPKLRTMFVDTPELPTDRLPDPSRAITALGQLLRRSSLDELPQLWCVIAGTMSLVGPRPALPHQEPLVSRRRAAGIDALLPGITGLAQVNGRDDLDDEAKLRFDMAYAARRSLGLDCRILWRTAMTVVARRGIRH